jgi:hypothetical protein
MSLRTYPVGVTGPRNQPTLLGAIRRAEQDLRLSSGRPQPRPVPPIHATTRHA